MAPLAAQACDPPTQRSGLAAMQKRQILSPSGRNPLDSRKGRKPWRNDAGTGLEASRRGFLGGTALAAVGAAIGNIVPLSGDGGGIPQAHAQAAAARRTEGAAIPEIPRQERQARPARRQAAGRRDAGKPARRRHHADREILHPQQRADFPTRRKIPTPGRSRSTARSTTRLEITLGELKSKYKAATRRMVLECGGNGRGAFSPPARGNQWTNGGAGCAEWTGVALADVLKDAGLKPIGEIHRALCGRPASVRRCHETDDLARRADREGARSLHHDRVGDERPAAAEHPWRPGAADRAGMGRARRRRNG